MRSRPQTTRPLHIRFAAVLALALAGGVLLASCGGSSKPSYCSDVNSFKDAVNGLTNLSSPSAIASSVQKVESTGQAAISSVKSAFAPETNALKSALTSLGNSAKQLTSSSTRSAALTAIPGEVTAVKTATDNFVNATKSKCG